jgi:glutamate/aspartate transport system substrate-binding protein
MPWLTVPDWAFTSASRIPLVQNGTVDRVRSTMNNVERQPLVAFSITIFVVTSWFLARTSEKLRTIADLKAKTAAATTGSNTTRRVRDPSAQMARDSTSSLARISRTPCCC